MIAPSTVGFSSRQSAPLLVTEMKSEPKKTPETPSSANSASASGDCRAPSTPRMSSVPEVMTGRPGKNFRVEGFGVVSVSMNMVFSQTSGSRPELDKMKGDAAEIAHRQTER